MAAADPDTAAMQEQVHNLKMKERELKKTIQEMTDENKIKVALQVKQIDNRNRLERHIEELQKKLRNMAEGSRHKLELLKREHNVELEDLKSLLYSGGGTSVTSPETEEARSKRSSVYLQILPPDEGAERISVSSSTKDLQNKLSQMEIERAELCGKFARAETELQAQLKALAEENATIKAELAAKSSTSMQEPSHTELQRCLDKMEDENKQIKGELEAKCNELAGVPAESPIDMDLQAHLKETEEENKRIQAELKAKCSALDYMTTQYQEKFRKEHDSYIDEMKKRTLSKLEEKEVDTAMEDIQTALTNQLSAANLKITDLELSIEQLKLSESDMSSELQNSKLTYKTQITAADEEVKRLQGRVDELAQSEGNLKEECDRLKKDYDLRMHAQDATVINMKNAVDNIKSQEDDVRSQMEATQRDYEKKLEETTLDYNHDMRKLAESIAMHQAELGNVVRELETARKESLELTDHFSAQLESKSTELDALYERSQQIAIQAEQTQKEQDEKLSTLRKDMQGKTIEIRQLKIELQEKSSALETANQRLAEAEKNLSVWKSAASEKQWSESELLRKVTEIETQAKLQREALQDKINFMSKQATEADSSDVYERMALLEATLAEREAAAVKQESHIAELSQQLKVQRDQYEATFADMDEVLARQMKKTSALDQQLREAREEAEVDRQAAVKDVEEQLEKKTQQVDEASSKMGDVRAESSDRVKELKSRIEDLTKRLADKDKQLMEKNAEMQVRLQAMLDDFEGERQMLILDTQATAKVLNERLDKERGSMNTFKENVKKQFDDRQDHVKDMMNTMKARFAETLKDKEEIFNRRVQKAEKAKEREKMQALKEREDKFQQQFVDYKERNEVNFKVAVQELKDKYEREIAALKGDGAGGKEATVIGDVVKADN